MFRGFNGTIFAYGQSGSGKTFTMLGPDSVVNAMSDSEKSGSVPQEVQLLYGIIPRTIAEIFRYLASAIEKTPSTTYEISVNYFEIYKEVIRDLRSGEDKL